MQIAGRPLLARPKKTWPSTLRQYLEDWSLDPATTGDQHCVEGLHESFHEPSYPQKWIMSDVEPDGEEEVNDLKHSVVWKLSQLLVDIRPCDSQKFNCV